MPGPRLAEYPAPADLARGAADRVDGARHRPGRLRVTVRRVLEHLLVCLLGGCWVPTLRLGLLLALVVVGLIVTIGLTLGPAGMFVVLAGMAVMRLLCERHTGT